MRAARLGLLSLGWIGWVGAGLVVLIGCGGPALPSLSSGSPSMSGMAMPAAGASAGAPTATQAMVCSGDVKGDVQEALALKKPPKTTSSYADETFTCTYTLPVGTMTLSVQHSASDAAGLVYLKSRAQQVSAGQGLQGLTEHAFGTGDGVVLVLKDNETLEVDTSALPEVFGAQQQKRDDLAYEVASIVLGCWTGHDQ